MEKVVLVGVNLNNGEDYEQSLAELQGLAAACDMETVATLTQALEAPHKGTYIGPGKIEELRGLAEGTEADLIIFDPSLSPTQLRNLQDALRLPIMDRSALILDIFAQRARSREAKLQVETARLQYLLPRLVGMHDALSRQGGGSGAMSNKGTGEKKLELDRRKLEHRLVQLRRELKEVAGEREQQSKKRAISGMKRVALVGYTNAGKSTLMNAMITAFAAENEDTSEKQVESKDMLFATLDTTVRLIAPPGHHAFLLSDTVGFIHKLPHNLVEAFQSTLEEAKEADVILEVIDYSDPHHQDHMEVTRRTLEQLGAAEIPIIYVYNKADTTDLDRLPRVVNDRIYMSAAKGIGLMELIEMMEQVQAGAHEEATFLIPYTDGRAVAYLNEHGVVRESTYEEDGTRLVVNCKKEDAAYYKAYRIE